MPPASPKLEQGSALPSPDHQAQLPVPEAQRLRPRPPFPRQRLGDNPRIFRAARGQRGGLRGPGTRCASFCERRVDLSLPPTERTRHDTRNTGDLGDPAAHECPFHADRARELAPQHRLVKKARRTRLGVQPAPVQRRPPPVEPAPEVRHQDVGVQLRITGPRGPMAERRSDEARRLLDDRPSVATPHRHGRPLEVPNSLQGRYIMSFTYRVTQFRATEPEQQAHALRRRERQIEPGDPCRTARCPQRSPVARVQPGQHVAKRLGRDIAAEPELTRGCADPLSPSLARRQVVVLDPLAHALRHVDALLRLVEVVLGLAGRQLADREHGCRPLIVKPTSTARGQRDWQRWRIPTRAMAMGSGAKPTAHRTAEPMTDASSRAQMRWRRALVELERLRSLFELQQLPR